MSAVVRLSLVALILAGCGSTLATPQRSVPHSVSLSSGTRVRIDKACAFYEVTLTVGLLERHLASSSRLNSNRGRRQWGLLLAEAHRAADVFGRSPAFHTVAASYRHLLTHLAAAGAALRRRDLDRFQAQLRATRAPLDDTEAAANKTTLGCKVKSSDGSATLSFGKG